MSLRQMPEINHTMPDKGIVIALVNARCMLQYSQACRGGN